VRDCRAPICVSYQGPSPTQLSGAGYWDVSLIAAHWLAQLTRELTSYGVVKMGEWSDYFEDFPEENPANRIPNPDALAQAREEQVRRDQAKLDAEIASIIKKHRKTP
jgi:hypothetical protein